MEQIWESGENGRHTCLRNRCLRAWGFESLLSYQNQRQRRFFGIRVTGFAAAVHHCGDERRARWRFQNSFQWVRLLPSLPEKPEESC